jgi:hypothetical protein
MARSGEATGADLERMNRVAILEARDADRIEPRAMHVTYDPKRSLILVSLRGGYAFGFPPEAVEGLQDATPEQLAAVRLSPSGDGLHWDDLDVDVSLTGLVSRALNLREWAPRIMGQVRSEAKASAARRNGLKGGRPPGRTRPKEEKAGVAGR